MKSLWLAEAAGERETTARLKGEVRADVRIAGGGFVLSWWAKLHVLLKLYGAQEGLRLARAAENAVRGLGAFCDAPVKAS